MKSRRVRRGTTSYTHRVRESEIERIEDTDTGTVIRQKKVPRRRPYPKERREEEREILFCVCTIPCYVYKEIKT